MIGDWGDWTSRPPVTFERTSSIFCCQCSKVALAARLLLAACRRPVGSHNALQCFAEVMLKSVRSNANLLSVSQVSSSFLYSFFVFCMGPLRAACGISFLVTSQLDWARMLTSYGIQNVVCRSFARWMRNPATVQF